MEMNILSLPNEILRKILSYSTYDEVTHLRSVCRKFNSISQNILNQGFSRVEKYHAKCLHDVKKQLPRRESERRKHPLARHCEILTAVATRLSLLGMTYMKYVDSGHCCFIPGKVIDEIYKVLHKVESKPVFDRTYDVLQELRDISSMAMEHFEEKISPHFKDCSDCYTKLTVTRFGQVSGYPCPPTHLRFGYQQALLKHQEKVHPNNRKIYQRPTGQKKMKLSIYQDSCPDTEEQMSMPSSSLPTFRNNQMTSSRVTLHTKCNPLAKEVLSQKQKLFEQKKKVTELEKKTAELEKKTAEQQSIITTQVENMRKQNLEVEQLKIKIMRCEKLLTAMKDIVNLEDDVPMEVSENKPRTTTAKRKLRSDADICERRPKVQKR